jgi:hypothetical protein
VHFFEEWTDPWCFADVDTTERRLASVGFTEIELWLEEAPVRFETPTGFAEFVSTVCVRPHLDALPKSHRYPFLHDLTEACADDDPPFVLDYWRLNISARRPPAPVR